MSFYRKKPITVEAFRWTGDKDQTEDPAWMIDALKDRRASIRLSPHGCYCDIATLEGVMTANPGDYIIKGVKGELYPCKPDIFAATYEMVEVLP